MTLFMKCVFEFLGTLVLILLGDGVVASNLLNKSKGQGGGWVVVTMGWGFAVMCGVFVAGPYSGAHLNPAVSLGLAIGGHFPWSDVLPYIVAQMLGGFAGAILVYMFYKDHFDATDNADDKLGIFCTMPAIEPVADGKVLLKFNGKEAEMVDKTWTNPYITCKSTNGSYTFWIKSIPAKKAGLDKIFNMTLEVTAEGYDSVIYNFELPIISDEKARTELNSNYTITIQNLVLFRKKN